VKRSFFARWQANFITGLVIVLPGVISVGALLWLFGSVTNVTDKLLFFLGYLLDRKWVYANGESGPMQWYWSLLAFLLAIGLVWAVGVGARYYFGQMMIEWVDSALMRVPFLSKIYGATKQVNEALTSGNKNSFKTVALVEFPHPGAYALGFITGEGHPEVRTRLNRNLVCVFVPGTPNPTSGFLLLLPEDQVIKLEMSVAEGIKYIISLGAISPEPAAPSRDRGTA
jgi:uncharacterized membrane protein